MRRSFSRSSPNSPIPAWSQAGWFVVVALAWSAIVLTLGMDPDYTAGELLDHLLAWRETGVLYPTLAPLGAEPPLRVFNYPPLVMLAVRAVAGAGLPALAAGRLVNGLGLLCLVAAVVWWARARGARGVALAGTVGLLGASYPLLYGAGQFHLELWAAAGTVWGFALLQRARTWQGAALGGLALALACFSKQTQLVPALVALGWIWTARRSAAGAATAAFIGAATIGAALITFAWGAEPWRQMLTYTVGTYSAANLAAQALSHLAPWLILVAFALWNAWSERGHELARRLARELAPESAHELAHKPVSERAQASDPALWYLIGALVWSVSAARVGSGYPYFLDVHLATVILVGPRIFGAAGPAGSAALRESSGVSALSRPWRWLLAAQIIGANIGVGTALAVNVIRLVRTGADLPALCASLGTERRIIAEEAGLMRACGRPALIHPFIMSSLAAQGRWDSSPFERALRDGAYPVVVLPFDPRLPVLGVHAERWTAGELAAFRTARVVDSVAAGRWVARW